MSNSSSDEGPPVKRPRILAEKDHFGHLIVILEHASIETVKGGAVTVVLWF